MFVGREEELAALERMYEKDDFQMAVIYGRRRVGKTSLIDEFVKGKPVLYFTAQQKTSRQNLELFSAAVYSAFSLPDSLPAFSSWNSAFDFLVERAQEEEGARLASSCSTNFPMRPRQIRRCPPFCRRLSTTGSSRHASA